MRNSRALLALSVVLAMGVAACSDDPVATTPTGATTAPATTATPTATTPAATEPMNDDVSAATPPGTEPTATGAPELTSSEDAAPGESTVEPTAGAEGLRAILTVDGAQVPLLSACSTGDEDVLELPGGITVTMPFGGAAEMTISSPDGVVEVPDVEMAPGAADDVIALTATLPPGAGIEGTSILVERNVVLDPC